MVGEVEDGLNRGLEEDPSAICRYGKDPDGFPVIGPYMLVMNSLTQPIAGNSTDILLTFNTLHAILVMVN